MRFDVRSLLACLSVAFLLVLTGCETTDNGTTNNAPTTQITDRLNVGDSVTIVFSDVTPPMLPFEERVKADGTITLIYNQVFHAVGKTRGELEQEVRTRYVPAYFKNLTVTIKQPERFFYVGGEIRNPSRQPYLGDITVTKAIASAGGFTDYANKKKVRVTRANGGKVVTVNCVDALDNPALDLPVYPGDSIHIPRSL